MGAEKDKIKVKTKKGGKGHKKIDLIKPGHPLPGKPSFKYDSAYLTREGLAEGEQDVIKERGVVEIKVFELSRQFLIFKKKGKMPRLTPKRPRLS